MSNLTERKAAYVKFAERVSFVKDLAEMFDIPSDENGNLVFSNHLKEQHFYEMLEEYDENVRHYEAIQDADRLEAEAEASQGKQALTDDDWERREEQERDDEAYAYLSEQ